LKTTRLVALENIKIAYIIEWRKITAKQENKASTSKSKKNINYITIPMKEIFTFNKGKKPEGLNIPLNISDMSKE